MRKDDAHISHDSATPIHLTCALVRHKDQATTGLMLCGIVVMCEQHMILCFSRTQRGYGLEDGIRAH